MRVSRQARELSIVTLFGNNVDGIGNVDNGLERSGSHYVPNNDCLVADPTEP